jgi:uncharacterized protein YktB (UPF0637 family)|tara:strand:- start:2832 stop:3128 length:297 start_codon:yes stop_codon:yes gene_type:complete
LSFVRLKSWVVQSILKEISSECWTDFEYAPDETKEKIIKSEHIESAAFEELITLLTYCQRGEKFCSGHWNSMLRGGYIKSILQRLAYLYKIEPAVEAG